ncbi:MAG: hypothetical protein NT076_04655 [Candidatus Pacearchaeota archaeon]|nr:hypothetical protein [Candidatus Pacearchaeota archaeon]
MQTWKWFGLIIPVVIFFFFAIISVFQVGLSINESSPKTLDKGLFQYPTDSNQAYEGMGCGNLEPEYITIHTINIKNDFIFTTEKQIKYGICFYSSELENQPFDYSPLYDYKIFIDGGPTLYTFDPDVSIKYGEEKLVELKLYKCQHSAIEQATNIFIFDINKISPEDYIGCDTLLSNYKNKATMISLK